jgi:hypothetical protein
MELVVDWGTLGAMIAILGILWKFYSAMDAKISTIKDNHLKHIKDDVTNLKINQKLMQADIKYIKRTLEKKLP